MKKYGYVGCAKRPHVLVFLSIPFSLLFLGRFLFAMPVSNNDLLLYTVKKKKKKKKNFFNNIETENLFTKNKALFLF
jgi:hypothetical protein